MRVCVLLLQDLLQSCSRGGRGIVCGGHVQRETSLRYTRGLGWRMHCGAEVTESSTNKQHHLSLSYEAKKKREILLRHLHRQIFF